MYQAISWTAPRAEERFLSARARDKRTATARAAPAGRRLPYSWYSQEQKPIRRNLKHENKSMGIEGHYHDGHFRGGLFRRVDGAFQLFFRHILRIESDAHGAIFYSAADSSRAVHFINFDIKQQSADHRKVIGG